MMNTQFVKDVVTLERTTCSIKVTIKVPNVIVSNLNNNFQRFLTWFCR